MYLNNRPNLRLIPQLPLLHRRLLLGATLVIAIATLWTPSSQKPINQRVQLPLSITTQVETAFQQTISDDKDIHHPPYNEYTIIEGDTLGGIFSQLQLSHNQMRKILESDENLALDTLKPGHTLKFWLGPDRSIETLQVIFHPGYYVNFERHEDTGFESTEVYVDGDWPRKILRGTIQGSLYLSAKKIGLTPNQIEQISDLFQDQINFARSLRAGDEFQVALEEQFIEGVATGESRILGARILNKGRELIAFRFSDGNYYDADGESLVRAFTRRPVKGSARISSPFNPKRKHPITGRISPHNGTDFAVPTGTPIYSPGDGVVTKVVKHAYAGLYIIIQHGASYRTRYLHLSKALVKVGQSVSRGQRIALSGNSGRSTGAHLHYEFHINGRAVNAMTAKIPMATSIAKKDLPEFKKESKKLLAAMLPKNQESLTAMLSQ